LIPARQPSSPARPWNVNIMNLRSPRSWLKAVLTAIGILLFIYLIRRIGLRTLEANLVRFGPWFFLTALIAASWLMCQTGAWWLIQRAFFQRMPFGLLYRLKIISDAFNLILPSASLGGDAMRAFMIKEDVPLRDGIPSVLFDKTIEFIASLIFLISGLFLGLISLRLPKMLTIPVAVSLGITTAGTTLLVIIQKRGMSLSLRKLGRLVPRARGWVLKHESQILAMDENFRLFYTRSNTKAFLPLALHVLARLAGTVEAMVIMAVLKAPVNFIQAFFICTVVTAGNSVFFILPGQWGVMEGVHVLVVQSLGYPAAIGLSLSVIRRIRKLLFAGLGLLLFASLKRKSSRGEGS
jgi:uncharacterized membrane protein YbhN (UPF0104 family)